MKNFLTLLIMIMMATTADAQSDSQTRHVSTKVSEKKAQIIIDSIRYLQSRISVDLVGVENDTYEYSMDSPTGNELEISIDDKSSNLRFCIVEENCACTNKENNLENWKGIYSSNFTIKVKIPIEMKKNKFRLTILEKLVQNK